MAEVCFVIQPFDGGRFDKRFTDVYSKAIVKAGLDPYRVDRDASASIPIQQIEVAISGAVVCLADITLDNPNVWFELGYGLALNKEICIICSEERKTPFPFDVQHRSIIRYAADSPQDFQRLSERIFDRLTAILDKDRELSKLPRASETADQSLNEMEIACIGAIALSASGIGFSVSNFFVKKEMEKLGYNGMGTNIALNALQSRKFISRLEASERGYNNDDEVFECYVITEVGWRWLSENLSQLNVKLTAKARSTRIDDDIPF
jgi:hypothetical protein